jgi:hypothetical protein
MILLRHCRPYCYHFPAAGRHTNSAAAAAIAKLAVAAAAALYSSQQWGSGSSCRQNNILVPQQWQQWQQSWRGGLWQGSSSSRDAVGWDGEAPHPLILVDVGRSQIQEIFIEIMPARPSERNHYKHVKCWHWLTKKTREQPCCLRVVLQKSHFP